jgi:hypothetical protein
LRFPSLRSGQAKPRAPPKSFNELREGMILALNSMYLRFHSLRVRLEDAKKRGHELH